MAMLPDERFSNRPQHTGAAPLPPPQLTKPIDPNGITPTPAGVPVIPGQLPPVPPTPVPPTPPNPIEYPPTGVNPTAMGGVDTLPPDMIGDIPPPPIPTPPITGSGVAGIHGTEAGTFSRPGSVGARPFRTFAASPKPQRFGPGVPVAGGGSTDVTGLGGDAGLGLSPEQVAEILRGLAGGGGGGVQ